MNALVDDVGQSFVAGVGRLVGALGKVGGGYGRANGQMHMPLGLHHAVDYAAYVLAGLFLVALAARNVQLVGFHRVAGFILVG